MEIKGTAVVSITHFVQDKFSSRYDEWLNSLPADSAEIMKTVMTSSWYPIKSAMIEPTRKICDLFFEGKEKGAIELGKYSADYSLKGVYKLFIKFGSPSFIISRASQIMPTFYKDSDMKVVSESKNGTTVQITRLAGIERLLELRIAGWMERALEICGCKNIKLNITRSLTKGEPVTEFVISWD